MLHKFSHRILTVLQQLTHSSWIAEASFTLLFPTSISRITEQLRLEGIFRGHLNLHCCSCMDTYSHLPWTVSWQLLSTSKHGDSTNSLGNLYQCLASLTVRKSVSWHSDRSSCVCAHCILSWHWVPPKRVCLRLPFLCIRSSGICTPQDLPWSFPSTG